MKFDLDQNRRAHRNNLIVQVVGIVCLILLCSSLMVVVLTAADALQYDYRHAQQKAKEANER